MSAAPVTVHPLATGRVMVHRRQVEPAGRGPLRLLATVADRQWSDWLPCWSFAVEHPDGVVVVDGGVAPGHTAARTDLYERTSTRWDTAAADALTARLTAAGLDPAAVRLHVLTHLHVDHVGGAGTLPGAELAISESEWRAAQGRGATLRGYRWPARGVTPRTLRFDGPAAGPFASSAPLTSDGRVLAIPTPGHTGGHLSVLVDVGDAWALLAGDAVYSEAQLRRGAIDGVAQSARAARATVATLQALCRERPVVVLPTHDPEAAARLATRTVATL